MAFVNGFSKQSIGEAITNKIQELIILPTEKCNLRCTYCYEDFSIGKMSEVTQSSIEKFMESRIPELKKFTLSWFGGEPLVAKDVVLRLSKHAFDLCEANGVVFDGGLTTNAVFLNDVLFNKLLDFNQNFYQITLDGWGGVHDEVRKHADGRGSFKSIWENLAKIQNVDRDFEIVLRIHVRRENIDSLNELMRELKVKFGDDYRFRLDFQHVRDLGGEGGKTVQNPVSRKELFSIERDLHNIFRPPSEINNVVSDGDPSFDVSDGSDLKHFEVKQIAESAGGQRADSILRGGNYICYAAKPNSLLIRADGRIGKCTVAFEDSRNTIGHIRSDGTVEIDNAKLQPWIRGLSDFDVQSLACPLAGMARS